MASAVIGALRVNLGIDTAAFSDGLKKAQGKLQNFGAIVQKGLVAGAAAAGAALTGLGFAVKSAIDAADDMAKSAQRFGIPIEELSRLKYAADLSGVSFNELGTGVRRLSQNMNDAAQGIGEGAKAFEQLGISVTNSDGTLKSTSEVMAEIADRFAAMPDGAEKTALAMDLMGRSGATMIPLLNGGAEALNNLMAEADTFGQVFSAEMGAQAEAFNDNLSRLTGTLGTLAARIAADLLPHLVRFTDWMVENAPAIQQWAGVVIEQFALFGQNIAQLKTEIDNIIAAFVAFRDGVTTTVNEVDATLRAWSEEIVGIFAAIPGQMLEIGRNIIRGLWEGVLGQWEIFKADVSGLASSITGTFKSVLGIHSPSTVMAEIGRDIMQGLSNGMSSMQDGINDLAGQIHSTIASAFEGIITGSKKVKDVLKDLLKQIVSFMLNRAIQKFLAMLGIGGGGGPITGFADGILSGRYVGLFAKGGKIGPGQWGIAGEAGPEIVTGPASVIPMSDIQASSVLTVRFVNERGEEVQRAQVRGGDQSVDVALDRIMAEKIATPGSATSRAIEERYGLRNRVATR